MLQFSAGSMIPFQHSAEHFFTSVSQLLQVSSPSIFQLGHSLTSVQSILQLLFSQLNVQSSHFSVSLLWIPSQQKSSQKHLSQTSSAQV
ncbi:hypothetical protein IJS64_02075 [bacterium]|nr:hypothetical protein [bacterium]